MTDDEEFEEGEDEGTYKVELFGGGSIYLQSEGELDRWQTLSDRYVEDYRLTKTNDLAMLDVILQQHISLYRAQLGINGMEPILDASDMPTGRYRQVKLKASEAEAHQKTMMGASKEIRALEKVLGIDKASRESQGGHTVDEYLRALKQAGNEYGVHITERFKAFEMFVNELKWRVRLEETGDDEDKRYHDCTLEGIVHRFCRSELEKLEQIDRDYAQQKQKLWVGSL